MRHIKRCVVCGKEFPAPPSSKKITCSLPCSTVRKKLSHPSASRSTPWLSGQKKKGAALDQARTSARLAALAAGALPEGQKGSQNRTCKVFVLKDPDNVLHTAIGLLPWAREHYFLFEPDSKDIEESARRISNGFRAILGRGASRIRHPVGSYKGWQVVYSGDKSADDQKTAMEAYRLTHDQDERNDTHEEDH